MHTDFPLRIAIIGAGASGTLLTVQLCKLLTHRPVYIYLIDKPEKVAKGLAYATHEPLHLLNVPAGKISALQDEPDHFADWLISHNLPYKGPDFVPRSLFGQYLNELLQEAISNRPANMQVQLIGKEAVSVSKEVEELSIQFSEGSSVIADKVVLALGNFPPGTSCQALHALPPTTRYAHDPWENDILEDLELDDPVLLVGSGLTMADITMSLYSRGHRGQILAVSTHGYLPNVHVPSESYNRISEEAAELKTVKEWLPFIRQHIQQATAQGLCWRSVIDAFRPYSQTFWLNLPVDEKRRFMRHMRHIWAIARHRLPPLTAGIIKHLVGNGQLKVQNGKITDAEISGRVIKLTIAARNGNHFSFGAAKVINCTGPESDYRKVKSPLIQDLLLKGFVSPDPLFLGLAASPDGRLLDEYSQFSEQFFSLGPPLKGMLWESTAIPEIRMQAKLLARVLVE